jgi:hypothetical protein
MIGESLQIAPQLHFNVGSMAAGNSSNNNNNMPTTPSSQHSGVGSIHCRNDSLSSNGGEPMGEQDIRKLER